MKAELKGKIELLSDDMEQAVILTLKLEDAAAFLAFLTGLELRKQKSFRVASGKDEAAFSGTAEIQCRISCAGKTEAFAFSPEQTEVVKCCCLDALLQTYEKPHVDFDFDQRSICIGFE